jgi:HlyD family secretion protein
VVAGAVIAMAVLAWGALRYWQGTPVDVAVVKPTRLTQTVVVSGRVLTPAKVDIGATVTGRVLAVKVNEGAHVAPGEVLIELERAELAAAYAQALAQEKSAATRITQWQEVSAPSAREQLTQAEANYRIAERDLGRQEQLFKQGFIGEARVDEARRNAAVARSQAEMSRMQAAASTPGGVDRRLLEDQLAQARAARETAAAKLAQTTLRAPEAGTVLARSVEPGDIVQPGKRLLALTLDGQTRLSALIDEKNLAVLKVGQPALVSADAFPRERFNATLSYLAPGVDAQRGTVEAKFAVPSPPAYLRTDMTVSIEISVADKTDALVVPLGALHDPQAPEPWVLVVRAGRAERVAVQLGARTAANVEIVSGLARGEQVIAGSGVEPGQRVDPR